MSRITLEVVPDPELFPPGRANGGGGGVPLGTAIDQLVSLIRAGIISMDEMRAQLGLPASHDGGR